MSFDINDYCARLKAGLLESFGDRLCYMGLQGSYLRGEAKESSDIDIMVILETLSRAEMDAYRAVIERLGDFERSCGFICSRGDMARWNPLEACQLMHTTKDIYGRLTDFLPMWTMENEIDYVKLSVNDLYHALCHTYIHGNAERLRALLPGLYKSAYFILQNLHFIRTGTFILPKAELFQALTGEDRAVMEVSICVNGGGELDCEAHFELLLHWCQQVIGSELAVAEMHTI